jgi:hypothetical protein
VKKDSAWERKLAQQRDAGRLSQQQSARDLLNKGSHGPHWHVFARQQEAFDFLAQRRHVQPQLRVFSFEAPNGESGQRRFLVASYEHFWERYLIFKLYLPSFYELIPEGEPCHLYFDLEFSRAANPTATTDAQLMALFFEALFGAISRTYAVDCDLTHAVVLDSSTAKKFSKHVIVHLPDCVFADNGAVGGFVQALCEKILATPIYAASLVVRSEDGQPTLVVDRGVYTRNRNFRLYLSSKRSKNTPLLLDPSCTFDFSLWEAAFGRVSDPPDKRFAVFRASLVLHTGPAMRVLTHTRPALTPRLLSMLGPVCDPQQLHQRLGQPGLEGAGTCGPADVSGEGEWSDAEDPNIPTDAELLLLNDAAFESTPPEHSIIGAAAGPSVAAPADAKADSVAHADSSSPRASVVPAGPARSGNASSPFLAAESFAMALLGSRGGMHGRVRRCACVCVWGGVLFSGFML